MKTAIIFFLLFSSLAAVYAQTAHDPPGQERAVFDTFHKALNDLTSRFGGKPASAGIEADLAQSLENIADYVKFLESAITPAKPGPKEYLESLALDAELLNRLARQESKSAAEKKKLYDDLKEVESDLEIKLSGARGPSDVARVIQVLVRAKKGEQDVGAYEVWYVPRGRASDPSVFKRFDGLTNPSNPPSVNLAPGRYFVWLSKGKPVTERQPLEIRLDGQSPREIDVVVP
ncbi:MAG TPA: hypothetical protein VK747_16875 [Blastocatellia bacterium]|nr:hypothetical protein [Blastocatellia bacterium]